MVMIITPRTPEQGPNSPYPNVPQLYSTAVLDLSSHNSHNASAALWRSQHTTHPSPFSPFRRPDSFWPSISAYLSCRRQPHP